MALLWKTHHIRYIGVALRIYREAFFFGGVTEKQAQCFRYRDGAAGGRTTFRHDDFLRERIKRNWEIGNENEVGWSVNEMCGGKMEGLGGTFPPPRAHLCSPISTISFTILFTLSHE